MYNLEQVYDLEDLINGEIRQQLGQKLYSAQKIAKLLGITPSALSKRLSRPNNEIQPLRVSNILIFTQEQLHRLLAN